MRTLLASTLILVMSAACVTPMPSGKVHGDLAASSQRVVLISSGTNRLSSKVIESFLRNVHSPVAEFIMGEDTSMASLEAGVRALKPTVVVALGGRAVAFSAARLNDLPLLFGLVIRSQLTQLTTQNFAGVALETSIATEFSLYRTVLPTARRVVTFYHPEHTKAAIDNAVVELKKIGITLEAIPVTTPQQLVEHHRARAHMNQEQATWLLGDPSLINAETFRTLRDTAIAEKQPLLCSSLREFAVAGAFMVVDIDFSNVGAQLADMADGVQSGIALADLGVRSPIGGKLIVNLETAAKVGIAVPSRVRPFISELLEP